MTVCKYFQQGNCKFGENCKFEHPGQRTAGFPNQNRFGALQNPPDRGNRNGLTAPNRKDLPYGITSNDIRNDLTQGKGRPQWILSAYGPGKNTPASLLDDNEYSFEELRLRSYGLMAAGNQEQANQEAASLWSKAEQTMADIVKNSQNVIKFMEDAEKKHPNRFDFCKVDGTKSREQIIKELEMSGSQATMSAFGAKQAGFGQPSNPNNPFAKPTSAFGQPTQPSAFGQPALAFGQPTTTSSFGKPGFGQPSQPASAFGQPAQPSGFGQPSLLGRRNAFGSPAPAAFGQPSQPTPSFGQSTQGPTFGQPTKPTTFGQPPQTSAFGQPAQPSAFGQPAQPSAFGQPLQPTPAFGQPAQSSAFGQPAQPSAFGQPAQPSSFGQPAQPSAFGQPAQPSAFGQPAQPSAFGQAQTPKSVFGQPSQSSAFGQNPQSAQPFGQQVQPSAFGKLNVPTSFGGQPATGIGASIEPTTAFGQPTAASTSFGKPPQPISAAEAPSFGQTGGNSGGFQNPLSTASAQSRSVPAFSRTANSSSIPHPLTNKPPAALHLTETLPSSASTTSNPATNKLSTFRGRQVKYINDEPCYERPGRDGWERIWFPQGESTPEVVALTREDKVKDFVGDDVDYTDDIVEQFKYLFDYGRFNDSLLPSVPPRQEWCVHDI